jgi:hypothetical protein
MRLDKDTVLKELIASGMPKEQADVFVARFVMETWYRTPSEIEQDHKNSDLLLAWGLPILWVAFLLVLILIIRKLRL